MPVPIVSLTQPPSHHFYGYYDKTPFDVTDRHVLGLECGIVGRLQRPDDTVTIGTIDLDQGNAWTPVAESRTWNWQMGCMAEWLPGTERTILYNDLRNGAFVSVIHSLDHGEQAELPAPFFELAPDGRSALTLNFARLWDLRPETGYCGLPDPYYNEVAPDADGISRLDLKTGETTRLISHEDMAGFEPVERMPADFKRYFTHLVYNDDGSRFMFWYRCAAADGSHPSYGSGVYTASSDGTDICLLNDNNSHCTWYDSTHVLAWVNRGLDGRHTYLFTDASDEYEIIGPGILDFNSHATLSPDKQWLLADMPLDDENNRGLGLYDFSTGQFTTLGRFPELPNLTGSLRCDLHPRWNRQGTQICFDSTHTGTRQMFLVDVSDITGSIR